MMDGIQQNQNQWIQGEAESQSAIMLAQHTTYFLKYRTIQKEDGTTELINNELLDWIEPYNPDYPLSYLKGGQKTLALMTKAQLLAYNTASKITSQLTSEQTEKVKEATDQKKYDLIAEYLSQDASSNVKFCVDYFNDYSRRKQSLIANSRTTGVNPQSMREFRTPIEPVSKVSEEPLKKWKLF